MFTGIVTALGEVKVVERLDGLMRLTIGAPYDAAGVAIGASIAHEGCCLTVVEAEPQANGLRYVVEVAPESLALATNSVATWCRGTWMASAKCFSSSRTAKAGA
jgi:riboflavin synthase